MNDIRSDRDRMNSPPSHPLNDAPGFAALLGAWLFALLAALLGVARRRALARAGGGLDLGDDDVISAVLRAEAEAELFYEPWVEWIAVPAPWRNGRLLPRRHEPRRVRQRGVRIAARMRGPPLCQITRRDERTGMA